MQTLMQTRKGTALAIVAWVGNTVALAAVWNVHGILMLLPIVFFLVCIIGGMGLTGLIITNVLEYIDHTRSRYGSYVPPCYLPILIEQVELNTLHRLNKRRERVFKAIEECRKQAKLYDEMDPRHITLTAQADHLTRLSSLVVEDTERVAEEIKESRRERRYRELMKGE